MLTVADKGGGGGGLSLADVSKNTKILAKIVSNQACLTLCVRLLRETTPLRERSHITSSAEGGEGVSKR